MKRYIYAILTVIALHIAAHFASVYTTLNGDQFLLYFVVGAVAALIFREDTYE